MLDTAISRRAALMGLGAVTAWVASPARALLQTAARLPVPSFVDALIAQMTLEEKAGQLSLMASAWGGSGRDVLRANGDHRPQARVANAVASRVRSWSESTFARRISASRAARTVAKRC